MATTKKKGGASVAASGKVAPAKGKLGVMVVGMGAVATTMIVSTWKRYGRGWPSRSAR